SLITRSRREKTSIVGTSIHGQVCKNPPELTPSSIDCTKRTLSRRTDLINRLATYSSKTESLTGTRDCQDTAKAKFPKKAGSDAYERSAVSDTDSGELAP